MGLDMYLMRKTYVKRWDHHSEKEKFTIEVKKGDEIFKDIDPEKISEITEEVIYWRKANHIHNWFIKNCAEGNDNCEIVDVSNDKLNELYQVCENVLIESKLVKGLVKVGRYSVKGTDFKLKDILQVGKVIKDYKYAEENLPTTGGFFFGSTEYDEYYYADVLHTLNKLKALKNENGVFPGNYYYEASW